MTFFGKLLTFLFLVGGIGAGVWSTSIYTQRPGWFEKAPDAGVDKGNAPISFELLKSEIDALGVAATASSKNWGDGLAELQAREKLRRDRLVKMTGLIARAKTGGKGGVGAFNELKEDEKTRLIDLDNLGPEVKVLAGLGSQTVPLQGADTLLDQFTKDAEAVHVLVTEIKMLRIGAPAGHPDFDKYKNNNQRELALAVVALEQRLLYQNVIRDQLQNEALYLATFEVNVSEQRDTVQRRKRQLERRLVPFQGPPKSGN